MYVSDLMAHTLKVCAIIATAAVIVYSRQYAIDRGMRRGELYTLALFALLGQMVMISGSNLLVLYLGLELMSLSLYAIAALRRDVASSSEAAMKYFVLGALSSGFLLYGMSMVYGATGSLDIPEIVDQHPDRPGERRRAGLRRRLRRGGHRLQVRAQCRSTCGFPTSTRARPRWRRC